MPAPTDNWVYNKSTVSEKDLRCLEKAKIKEQEMLGNGWQYFEINPRLKVLVPYKDGNPTEQGRKTIETIKKLVGIK